MNTQPDDHIFPITRLVAGIVVPVLVLAFIILYFFPELSGQRFAWEIQPSMTAMFMGAGYLGGAWLFANALFGRRWHRVAAGFLPVTTFTVAMLLATILHWSRFDIRHFPFQLWLGLYILTPFLVPWLWLRNRVTDPGTPEAQDVLMPSLPRWSLGLLGAFLFGFALFGFVSPTWLLSIWIWKLTPLTARVLSGWFALLGVGGLVISRDRRWSAWRVGLQSIGLWHLLVVIAALLNPTDFTAGLLNWYLVSVVLVLLGMLVLFVQMESRRKKAAAG
ncbi:MAG: hypothetical protein JSV61_14065 [Anaerolineales bacterium]|nr:MAG: hypothetical protein JSV61_14065 [Anaerolineales bacterium]